MSIHCATQRLKVLMLNRLVQAQVMAASAPWAKREILLGTARLLMTEAACLRAAHGVLGRWVIQDVADAEAKRVYDDMRRHAKALTAMVNGLHERPGETTQKDSNAK